MPSHGASPSSWSSQHMNHLVALALSGALVLTGCDQPAVQPAAPAWTAEGKTMGTFYRVTLANAPPEALVGLKEQISQLLEQDNHELSTYQADSDLSVFNHYTGTDPQRIPSGMADIISTALRIGVKTAGAMHITVGPLVNLWGFGPDKQPVKSPDRPQIEAARLRVGLRHIRLSEDIQGHWLQKDLPSLY